jgi:peptidoglycan/LPS O-acetylase OafA/YrhL
MRGQSAAQINALTGLRFFAATIVVLFHFAHFGGKLLQNFIAHGFVGVTIFFVLSGFILAYTYSTSPGVMKGTKRSFWVARFARLYPMYLLGIAFFLPSVLHRVEPTSLKVLSGAASVLLAQAWLHPLGLAWGMWNPPGWSLSAEAFFYLLFPLFCPVLSSLPKNRLTWVALVCSVVSLAAPVSFLLSGSADLTFWIFPPLFRLPEFLLGIAVGLLWKNRRTTAFDSIAPYSAMAAMTALVLCMCTSLHNEIFYNGATSPLAALLICSLACGRGLLAKLFAWAPVVAFGAASYSLYILHWAMWDLYEKIFGKAQLASLHPSIFFAIYFCITIFAAWICHKYIEEPLNIKLRKRLMPAPQKKQLVHAGDK